MTVYLNIPNLLSIFRILSIPLLMILLSYDRYAGALAVFILAAVSDGLDGFIARRFKQKTRVGAYLDPIADKLLLTSSFVVFAVMRLVPTWLAILVVSRDVIIALGIVTLQFVALRVEIRPSALSKCTTVLQLAAIGMRLLFELPGLRAGGAPHLIYLYWATGILTVASGMQYVVRGVRLISEPKSEV